MTRALWLLALAVGGSACQLASTFGCETPADCAVGRLAGVCEAEGFCSFPDGDCASGRRYGEHAPAEIAGVCTRDADGSSDGSDGEAPATSDPGPVTATTEPTVGDDAGSEEDTGNRDADVLLESTDASTDGGSDEGGDESTAGAEDTSEPFECGALDCAACLDCAGATGGPCDDELTACTDTNGCTSGAACMQDCMLTGLCLDPCCEGGAGPMIDQVMLCKWDQCIDACARFEVLTCG